MDIEELQDRTTDFLTAVDGLKEGFTNEEKANIIRGLEGILTISPLDKLLSTFKTLILQWMTEWKRKQPEPETEDASKKVAASEKPERARLLDELPKALRSYHDALSQCDVRDLSAKEEKRFGILKDYIRGQIRGLSGNTLEESEDMR